MTAAAESLRWSTTCSISAATAAASWCSQNRLTAQPTAMSSQSWLRSRSTFARSFARHHSRLALGVEAWSGHECQKQPSRNTATRSRLNTMSGRDVVTSGIALLMRYRRPFAWRSLRTRISSGVSRRGVFCIRRRTDEELGPGVLAVPDISLSASEASGREVVASVGACHRTLN